METEEWEAIGTWISNTSNVVDLPANASFLNLNLPKLRMLWMKVFNSSTEPTSFCGQQCPPGYWMSSEERYKVFFFNYSCIKSNQIKSSLSYYGHWKKFAFLWHYAFELRLLDLPEKGGGGAGRGGRGLFKTIIIHFATLLKTRDLTYVPDLFCLAFEHKLLGVRGGIVVFRPFRSFEISSLFSDFLPIHFISQSEYLSHI